MSTSVFPGALDTITDPAATDKMNAPSHAGEHTAANDAIEAIEAYLGVSGAPNFLPVTGGTMSAAFSMGTNKIQHVANGTASDDVAAVGQIPAAYTSTPAADSGAGSAGTGTQYARGNHVHPAGSSGVTSASSPGSTMALAVSGSSLTIDDARETLLRPSGVLAESIPRWLCRDEIPVNPVGADAGYTQATAVPIILQGGMVISKLCFRVGQATTPNSNHCYCFLFNTAAGVINCAVATTADLGNLLQSSSPGDAIECPIAQVVSGAASSYTVPGSGAQLFYLVIYAKDNTGTTMTFPGLNSDLLSLDATAPMLALASSFGYGGPPNITSGTYNHGFGDNLPLLPNFDVNGGGFGGGIPYAYVK